MKLTKIILCCLFIWVGSSAQAAKLFYDLNDLKDDGVYEEDVIFFGETLTFTGETRDLYFLGKYLLFSGMANQGIISFGEDIDITGPVNNGLITGGREIHLDAPVTGTVFMAGEKLRLGDQATLWGSAFFVSRSLDIGGKINGDIHAAAAEINLSNEVVGDVKVTTGRLTIADNGRINGNLHYNADYELSAEEASRVSGQITYSKHEDRGYFHQLKENRGPKNHWWFSALFMLSFLITGLLMLLLPVTRSLDDKWSKREFWMHSLWGLIPVFIYPTAILLFTALIITIPLALILLLGGLPLMAVTVLLGSTFLGRQLVGLFRWNINSRFLYLLIGGLLCAVLSLIPFVNLLLLIFLSSLGWGYLLSGIFRKQLA